MGFSTPKGPYMVGGFVDSKRFTNAVNLDIVGNYAYVAASGRLNIIDISKPSLPVVIGSLFNATNLSGIGAVRVLGNYAFCACEQRGSMAVIDVTDPYNPVFVTENRGPVPGTSLQGASNIKLNAAGTLAFITTITPRHSLAIIDISTPTAPVWVADTQGPTPNTSLNNLRNVLLSADEKTAYCVGDNGFTVAIVDVTTPSAPVYVKNIGSGNLAGGRGICFSPDGKLLWVAAGSTTQSGTGAWKGGIQAFDVSGANQNNPQFVSFFGGYGNSGSQISYLSGCRTLIAKDNYLYQVSESGKALVVFNVTNPKAVFIESGSLGKVPGTSLNGAMNMMIKYGYAFVTLFQGNGFAVMNMGGYPSP
jgi:hypothetical protein